MSVNKISRQPAEGSLLASLRHGYARIAAAIPGFAPWRVGARSTPAGGHSAEDVVRAARLFAEAVREDSNLAMDWLWCASQLVDDRQRRYCIERALAIDPGSDLAWQALADLPPEVESSDALLFARPADRSA